MSKIFSLLIFLFLPVSIFSQTWQYAEQGNKFDGLIKVASVKALKSNALFVVNQIVEDENINTFVTNAEYAGCDDKIVNVAFEEIDEIFPFRSSSNSNREAWFLTAPLVNGGTTIPQLFVMIRKYSKMYIRLESSCGQRDYEFPLTGSSDALAKAIGNLVDFNQIVEQSEVERVTQERILEITDGGTYMTKMKNNAYVRTSPEYSAIYRIGDDPVRMEAGEVITINGCNVELEYCRVLSASETKMINSGGSTMFFVQFSSLDLRELEKID